MPFDTSKKLSILVPYRDRPNHLKKFVPHMLRYFQRDKIDHCIAFDITLVEQGNELQFNAGLLRNIGFLLTREADYHCFHDVDFLPIWADYSYPDKPTRIVWYRVQHRPVAPGSNRLMYTNRETFFGGVVMFRRQDFEVVNGYSNAYWGWGAEDDDLRKRCLAEGLDIEHRDGTFQFMQHVSRGFDKEGESTPESLANQDVLRHKTKLIEEPAGHRDDGLNTARYTVTRQGRIPIKNRPVNVGEIQKITVNFDG
ncbi:MAG: galactosyltransferase-related protein [Alphaproteobacteria bacterium]